MVATLATSAWSPTSRALASSWSLTASTAVSMPRLRASGCAPAATLRRPSRTIACASTVAVVVASPATSCVVVEEDPPEHDVGPADVGAVEAGPAVEARRRLGDADRGEHDDRDE